MNNRVKMSFSSEDMIDISLNPLKKASERKRRRASEAST